MKEFTKLSVQFVPAKIKDNLDMVKEDVLQLCKDYTSIVITEENLKDGTEAMAIIRAKKKAIEDERKAIKNEWNAPYDAFAEKVKEITTICDNAVSDIQSKLQEYENKRLEEKNIVIDNIWEQIRKEHEEACEYLTIGEISAEPTGQKTGAKYLRDKWLTKTYEIPKIRTDMEERILLIEEALTTIRNMQSRYEKDALKTFKLSKSINDAIQTIRNMEDHERRIQEEERKRQEEAERQRAIREAAEERRRKEEAERQKRLLEEAQARERIAKEEAAKAEQARREEEERRKVAERNSIKIPPKQTVDDWSWDEPKEEKMYKFLCLVPESVMKQFADICENNGYQWQSKES